MYVCSVKRVVSACEGGGNLLRRSLTSRLTGRNVAVSCGTVSG